MNPLHPRVVVITGGSAGIGAALARELARRGGYSIVLASRTAEALQQVAGELSATTHTVVAAVIADVIEHPVAEVYTNPATAGLAKRYYDDVGAFEEGARS